MPKENTQAFLLGVSAAIAGFLLYICATYAAPVIYSDFSRTVNPPQTIASGRAVSPRVVADAGEFTDDGK